ncbi:MAG: hypothetical protein ACREJB_16490 [Planctomycetaceae bacterium]
MRRVVPIVISILVAFVLCSCAAITGSQTAMVDPFLIEVSRDAESSERSAPPDNASASRPTSDSAEPLVRTAEASGDVRRPVQTVAGTHEAAVTFSPSIPRTDLADCVNCPYPPGAAMSPYAAVPPGGIPVPGAAGVTGLVPVAVPLDQAWPDEYLCDGGDRGYPIHYNEFGLLELDTEDAAAEYRDDLGKLHVKPTNKVCIYAPRFAAAVNVSGPAETVDNDRPHYAIEELTLDRFDARVAIDRRIKNAPPLGLRVRTRASGVESEIGPGFVTARLRQLTFAKLNGLYQDISFVHTGRLVETEEAYLARHVEAAFAWSQVQYPVIQATTAEANQIEVAAKPREHIGIEDKRTPGRLRIVKLADKATAQPGEIVTFTLRFDNLGERPLYDIRILDNLTPRLEYVEESETSTRPGDIIIEPNGEGSVLLRFVLDDPLPGGEGGVITFQARVR